MKNRGESVMKASYWGLLFHYFTDVDDKISPQMIQRKEWRSSRSQKESSNLHRCSKSWTTNPRAERTQGVKRTEELQEYSGQFIHFEFSFSSVEVNLDYTEMWGWYELSSLWHILFWLFTKSKRKSQYLEVEINCYWCLLFFLTLFKKKYFSKPASLEILKIVDVQISSETNSAMQISAILVFFGSLVNPVGQKILRKVLKKANLQVTF